MLAVLRWLSRRPLSTLHRIGAALGWLVWALSPTYRRRLRENAAQAGIAAADRRQAVAQAGRMTAELPWLWLRPADRPLGEAVRWDGDAHLQAALDAGTGVLLLTPHLGCWEVCAQAIAERWGDRSTLTAMYRPARQDWLRELEETARARPGLATVPASLAGVRQLLRALRRGEMVGVLPDQVPPEGMGTWAPFFGREAYTMTLATKLARQSGAALLLIWAERLPQGAGFRLRVAPAPALPRPAAGATEEAQSRADATALNGWMEALVRQSPGQYLWGYHRYKQPRGAAPAAAAPASTGGPA
ncbi:MAG: hypothetical protein RLY78_448 [Pseudomonadota bacterium]